MAGVYGIPGTTCMAAAVQVVPHKGKPHACGDAWGWDDYVLQTEVNT